MSPCHYLALDQGSHASRAFLFDDQGCLVRQAERPVATHHLQPGWVEHDAEALIESLEDAVGEVLDQADAAGLVFRAAGLAIQRSSVVCWNRQTGAALSPVLSWQDRRNASWLAALSLEPARLKEITGLVPSAHYGASKLHWCLANLPEVRRALEDGQLCCGPLASFVLHRLLEERPCVTDPANASRTLLWDLHTRDWSPELLEACTIPRDALPDCVPSRYAFGTLKTGRHVLPLTVCTGDQSAALFAWGEPHTDSLLVNIGTGAFVQRVAPGIPPAAPGLLQSIAWQDDERSLGVVEGTVNGAGAALDWLARRHDIPLHSILEQAEACLAQAPNAPLFVNGVGGLGAPWWVPDFPTQFTAEGDFAAEAAAVLESIVFLLQANIEAIRNGSDAALGVAVRIRVSGGLARLDGLCQRLADLSGLPVERPAEVEATAQGTAWLLSGAAASAGAPTRFEACGSAGALHERYRRWRALLESTLRQG
jgi:glycerol kinase